MNTILFTFDRDHTHEGVAIHRGAKRELPAHHADWLIAQGVAHPTPSYTQRERIPRRDDTTGEPDHATH